MMKYLAHAMIAVAAIFLIVAIVATVSVASTAQCAKDVNVIPAFEKVTEQEVKIIAVIDDLEKRLEKLEGK